MENDNSKLRKFKSGGTRSADADEERFDLISPFAILRIAKVMREGCKSHGEANWERGIPVDVTLNHLERHLQLWKCEVKSGKKIGEDDHLAKVAWGVMAILHYQEVGPLDMGILVPYADLPPNKKK